VSWTTKILDARDGVAVEESAVLEPTHFGRARAADVTFAVPVVRLAPGEYVLTFEAAMGKDTARRSVRFAVVASRQ
jgi:hypothetical protein